MSARADIWAFVQREFPCLEMLAQDIATGISKPQVQPKGGPPLNFLANGVPPSQHPGGLAGLIAEPNAASLAAAKNSDPDGFQAENASGLGIMFGTWSDFCLWSWCKHPADFHRGKSCRLILARDFGALQDILLAHKSDSNALQPIIDWGQTELHNFYSSTDPSTKNLFTTLHQAGNSGAGDGPFSENTTAQLELERLIARKRIFIYNVWPWFRSGTSSVGDDNIHRCLHHVPEVVTTLGGLVRCLDPKRVACLGGWSWDTDRPSANDLMLQEFELANRTLTVDVFRHPSARPPTGWKNLWRNPLSWGEGERWNGKRNDKAFVDFVVNESVDNAY